MALLGKWWWRFKWGPESLWKDVIKALYGDNGGLGAVIPSNRRTANWGIICNLDRDLTKVGIDINQILFFDDNRNCWNWDLEADGMYTVRSLRKEIDSRILDAVQIKTTWCKAVPRKVNLFVWRLLRDKLPTRDNLQARGVDIPSHLCPACNCHPESTDHLFLRCSTAKIVMAQLISWRPLLPTLDDCATVASLFHHIANLCMSPADTCKYEVILRAFLWVTWNNRNSICFRGMFRMLNP